jgi:hypothetical protein
VERVPEGGDGVKKGDGARGVGEEGDGPTSAVDAFFDEGLVE